MYSLEDGLKWILTEADKPRSEIDFMMLEAKCMEFAAVIEKIHEIPAALLELMPQDMRRAAIQVAVGALFVAVQEGKRASKR